MNRHMLRAGWVKLGLLLALITAGGAAGLYLSGAGTQEPQDPGEHHATTKPADGPAPPVTHRFPLTARDAKDSVEAPELATDDSGRIFLTWASKTGDAERTVFLSRTSDNGKTFDTPRGLSKGGVFKSRGKSGYERRATPHLGMAGDKLLLAWSGADLAGAGIKFLWAESADAGDTFSTPVSIVRATESNATFISFTAGPGGDIGAAWLAGAQQVFAAVRRAGASAFEEERLVYAGQDGKGVCPCCATAVCFGADGTLYVGFRNIQGEYRDIAVARLRPGQKAFEGPFPVTPDTWKLNGCPHDGPSLAVVGGELHVVWMDAHSGPSRCYHARARLADLKFEARPLYADGPGTQGNAKLCADATGGLHVVFEQSLGAESADAHAGHHQHAAPKAGAGGGRAIHYARLAPGQTSFGPARSMSPKPGVFQSRPTVVAASTGDLWAAWNELDETGKAVVVTRLPWGIGHD